MATGKVSHKATMNQSKNNFKICLLTIRNHLRDKVLIQLYLQMTVIKLLHQMT